MNSSHKDAHPASRLDCAHKVPNMGTHTTAEVNETLLHMSVSFPLLTVLAIGPPLSKRGLTDKGRHLGVVFLTIASQGSLVAVPHNRFLGLS